MHAFTHTYTHIHAHTHTYTHTHKWQSLILFFGWQPVVALYVIFFGIFSPRPGGIFCETLKKKNTAVFALRLGVDETRAFAGSSAPCSLWLDPLWEFTLL